jgi:hypothetical protein
MESLTARIGGACAQIRETSQQQARGLQEEWAKVQHQLNESQTNAATGAKKAMNSLQDAISNMIQETRNHLAAEEERVDAVKIFATESAEREVATLREQNQLLTTMLEQERQKSLTAREKLSKNIADLLVGFTSERDADLTEAITSVQDNITASEAHAQRFVDGHHEKMEELRAASQTFSQTIEEREKTTRRHRKKGEGLLTDAHATFSQGVAVWAGTLEASLSEGSQSFDKLAEGVAAEVQQGKSIRVRASESEQRLRHRPHFEQLAARPSPLWPTRPSIWKPYRLRPSNRARLPSLSWLRHSPMWPTCLYGHKTV